MEIIIVEIIRTVKNLNRSYKRCIRQLFSKLYITVELEENCCIYENKTSAIRGGMGQMLLLQHCLNDSKHCENCELEEQCIPRGIMYAKYKKKPDFVTSGESMGYTLSCLNRKPNFQAGETFTFTLTLFGNTVVYFNPVINALAAFGQTGFGKEHIPFSIVRIQNRKKQDILENGAIIKSRVLIECLEDYVQERMRYPVEGKLSFLSPVAIKHQGEFLKKFDIQAIMNATARRIYMLNCFEGLECEMPKIDCEEIEIGKSRVYHNQVKRYSTAKQNKVELDGISGEVYLEGLTEEMKKILFAGEITQIGKNTRFGFGVYRLG